MSLVPLLVLTVTIVGPTGRHTVDILNFIISRYLIDIISSLIHEGAMQVPELRRQSRCHLASDNSYCDWHACVLIPIEIYSKLYDVIIRSNAMSTVLQQTISLTIWFIWYLTLRGKLEGKWNH